MKGETRAVHSGAYLDNQTRGTNTPIYTSTAIGYLDSEVTYPRYFNTVNQLAVAQKIASLENGEAGLVFSSGMAAITSTFSRKDYTGEPLTGLIRNFINSALILPLQKGTRLTISIKPCNQILK
jgi:cystathionine beta-lyase